MSFSPAAAHRRTRTAGSLDKPVTVTSVAVPGDVNGTRFRTSQGALKL